MATRKAPPTILGHRDGLRITRVRLGKPEKVIGLVTFLISEQSASITGQVLARHGGTTA